MERIAIILIVTTATALLLKDRIYLAYLNWKIRKSLKEMQELVGPMSVKHEGGINLNNALNDMNAGQMQMYIGTDVADIFNNVADCAEIISDETINVTPLRRAANAINIFPSKDNLVSISIKTMIEALECYGVCKDLCLSSIREKGMSPNDRIDTGKWHDTLIGILTLSERQKNWPGGQK